ncbi:MAG: substrate-binding domain-containing protein [Planctomycetota bacterium]|nr:substrate-binding domain-containing protein [Planctomycetota bacterium]
MSIFNRCEFESRQFRLKRRCQGEISLIVLLGIITLVGVGLLFYLMLRLRPEAKRDSTDQQSVTIYCAAGIAKPVQQVLERYNREFGTHLKISRTGGSGQLAGQIKTEFETGVQNGAELYITADQFLLDKAKKEGIVEEQFQLAVQRPVIAVRSDSGVKISDFQSLAKSTDLRFGITSQRAAVGKLVRKIAEREDFLSALEMNKVTDFENVMTLAQALVTQSIDAALVWDTTVAQVNQNAKTGDTLSICCPADSQDSFKSNIAIGVVTTARNPTMCLKLARYLTSPENGQSSFEQFGFTFLAGDTWQEVPEIHLFCGSMFTPVIEESVREFAQREGINLYPKWEGCGKLVTRMQTSTGQSKFPDAYFACDEMFLEKVKEHFQKPTTVTKNQIVIAVQKHKDLKISSPSDLLKPGLRVGICDPQQSALGLLTRLMLEQKPYQGFYAKLSQKSAVTVDVGPTLISQLLAGGLDAAIVYRSNIQADPKALSQIAVLEFDSNAKHSLATQPWAISRSTPYPELMNRMFTWIQQEQIKKRFEKFGFKLVQPEVN